MTAEPPDRGGTNRRWIEDVLDELLDEDGGESTDEQAFENAKRAARDLGAMVNALDDLRGRSDQNIADLCGTAFEYGALFASVQLNHDLRRELLGKRGRPEDVGCVKQLEAFHVRHMETLADEFLDQIKVDRFGKLVSSLWQKSIDRSRPESTEWRRLGGMAMGKKPAARQPSPMWVTTADLPTSAGHPFFERLNRVLEEAGFDAFVEGLCAVFYASRLGRPSLRPGRYFRLLFIGYFEGLSSERGIAWRVADSLSLRAFLDLDVTEAPPNHSTLSRTRRLIDVETHVAVFTWVLERLAGAGLVQGKTVGVDATTLEANAAMRSIERRDTGESYEAFVRQLAKASGIETPTRAELARFDRSRKDRKTSNKEWQSPQDTDAKIAKMKDGRTHLAHKAEHGIDLETGAILSVTVQEASEGDSATLPATLTMAAEQVEAVQPAGAEVEEVVADKGYHSDATLVALDEIGVRSYVSEPERGRRCWQDKKTGETPAEKRAAQKALYGNRRRIRGDRGRRLQRRRGELVERPFAHQYETGGLRRVWVRGHENVRKRVLIQAAGCNLGLLLRRLTGVGTPRSLQGRALSAICGLICGLLGSMQRNVELEATIVAKYAAVSPVLDERSRRRWAAAESVAIGYGGDALVSSATGLARETIRKGRREITQGGTSTGRIRRPGAGRRRLEQRQPGLLAALEGLVDPRSWRCRCRTRPGTTRSE